MRLQMNFDLAMDVRHVGSLALIGTAEKYGSDGDSTIVTFLLTFSDDQPLAQYFCPEPLGGFMPYSLLCAIFVGEGFKVMESPLDSSQRILIFTREVAGNLRDVRKFLHATGEKLLRELQELEEGELWLLELDDQMEWAEHAMIHPNRRGPMPDFTRPRHR